jgi:septal ring factor EnvC (AmiA/AmiB activator)
MNTNVRRFIVTAALCLALLPVQSLFAQQSQTDLDFIARMNLEATSLYDKANDLDGRLAQVDPNTDGKKKRKALRDDLKTFKKHIREEQQRMDGKDFKKDKSKQEQEKRMRKLSDQLRGFEGEMNALGY